MSVTIRLSRQGAKKNPQYLIVAAHKRSKRDGEYLAKLGYYYPKAKESAQKVKLDLAALNEWRSRGAQLSETVGQLVKSLSN